MAVCDETCNCEMEGDRGLLVTGDGEAATPFVVSPDAGRTIPRTEATFVDLPTLADEEAGQLAFVEDTGLVYVWCVDGTDLEDGWQVVAPDWAEVSPADVTIGVTAVFVASTGLTLGDGRWDVIASGDIDLAAGAGTTPRIRIELFNVPSAHLLDRKVVTLANDNVAPDSRTASFALMAVTTSGPGSDTPANGDKVIALNIVRDSAEAGAGAVGNIKIRAVRIASPLTF